MRALTLRLHPGRFSVCQLPAGAGTPVTEGFFSVTNTPSETSVICREGQEPPGAKVESGWSLLEFAGPFAFEETGILAAALVPLADARIGIFALSTFDTDWLLVKESNLAAALAALRAAGHHVSTASEIQ